LSPFVPLVSRFSPLLSAFSSHIFAILSL
jgi:hypothetical protein